MRAKQFGIEVRTNTTSNILHHVMAAKKGATKHCCWGKCNSGSRYSERLPENVYFIRFPKPGAFKDGMTDWQKQQETQKTEKCKRWIHACGRKSFTLSHIKKYTYICSLHFVGGNGPTVINPDPIFATSSKETTSKVNKTRKAPKDRTLLLGHPSSTRKRKLGDDTGLYDNNFESQDEDESCSRDDTQLEIDDQNLEPFQKDQETQTVYDRHILGAKVETMMLRNKEIQKHQSIYRLHRVQM
ncbi:uncharacterized protein LOC116602246 [Nematostella vectensis]|uniref:uncharacterized protein LOC116602246 n=1 Tax=Nematostella vectensis TaxID=45351 RepID=UPI002077112E|nr:uncharacterized protein LOC116602246 [Nematostella vectensis]